MSCEVVPVEDLEPEAAPPTEPQLTPPEEEIITKRQLAFAFGALAVEASAMVAAMCTANPKAVGGVMGAGTLATVSGMVIGTVREKLHRRG